MVVLVDKNDVEVAAVAQFLAAELAVGDDGEVRFLAVAPAQEGPGPAQRDVEYGLRQCAEVVRDLFGGQAALDVAGQRAEGLGMVGAAQQVEQGFLVVLAGGAQRGAAGLELAVEGGAVETFVCLLYTSPSPRDS